MYRISKSDEWNYCLNLMLDDSVSEIESNGPGQFFMKKSGQRVQITDIPFSEDDDYVKNIEVGLVPHVKSNFPYIANDYIFEGPIEYKVGDKKIKGRCHIVLAPASDWPQVTIAKKSTSLARVDDIAIKGSMSEEMLVFMKAAISANLTIVLSGGTGAGKTTMLEALTKLIPSNVRIGVAEDTPELVLTQPNVTYLQSVPWKPGMNKNDIATLSWVVKQTQRMRTDKIIIGETRGEEFADFLVAANSGMDGSLTTIHAENPSRCLEKMTNFALRGSDRQPVRSVNQDIANAINIIIQLIYTQDGKYRVSAIQEITSTIGAGEDAKISTAALYTYDEVTDSFYKGQQMTDNLRKLFMRRGVSYEQFFPTKPGEKLQMLPNVENTETSKIASRGIPTGPNMGRRML
jgi:pilus assembly protein CpaF